MNFPMRAVSSLIQPQIALFKNKCHYSTLMLYSKGNWVNMLLHLILISSRKLGVWVLTFHVQLWIHTFVQSLEHISVLILVFSCTGLVFSLLGQTWKEATAPSVISSLVAVIDCFAAGLQPPSTAAEGSSLESVLAGCTLLCRNLVL